MDGARTRKKSPRVRHEYFVRACMNRSMQFAVYACVWSRDGHVRRTAVLSIIQRLQLYSRILAAACARIDVIRTAIRVRRNILRYSNPPQGQFTTFDRRRTRIRDSKSEGMGGGGRVHCINSRDRFLCGSRSAFPYRHCRL